MRSLNSASVSTVPSAALIGTWTSVRYAVLPLIFTVGLPTWTVPLFLGGCWNPEPAGSNRNDRSNLISGRLSMSADDGGVVDLLAPGPADHAERPGEFVDDYRRATRRARKVVDRIFDGG